MEMKIEITAYGPLTSGKSVFLDILIAAVALKKEIEIISITEQERHNVQTVIIEWEWRKNP